MLMHHRTFEHYGTEDTTTTTLVSAIGRYPQGMSLQTVLEDMAARLSFVEEVDCGTHLYAYTNDAVLLAIQGATMVFNAVLRDPSQEVTANAVIYKSVVVALPADAVVIQDVNC